MSKRKDPIVAVLHYFETADQPVAETALALAKAIVARRRPIETKAPKRSAKKSRRREVDVPLPLDQPAAH
jgi:hypothetical protein